MIKFFSISTILFSLTLYSQVGINTTTPKSNLDVSIKRDAIGIADNTQLYGLLPPRITRAELTDNTAIYNADQKGAIIYITDISGGNTNIPRTNMDSVGYYYFDGTLWQKIIIPYTVSNGLTMAGNNNAKLGGNLTEPTVISGASSTNRFSMTGSGIDAINLDNNTLSIDATNHRIGFGKNNPSEKLDVAGNIALSTDVTGAVSSLKFYENTANGTNSISVKAPNDLPANRSFTLPSNNPSNEYVLTTNAAGETHWGAVNPASATLASISLINESVGSTSIVNGGVAGASVNQRFFQKFDTTVTDPNGRFNVSTGTYTVAQSGIYLISAYIMPNAAPDRNTSGFFYPVNLEIRKMQTEILQEERI